MTLCGFGLLAVLLAAPLAAQGPRVTTPPDDANVQYGRYERNVLDLWRGGGPSPSPVVVYFHAGGFTGGDKSHLPQALLEACRRRGFSVVSANYRFSTQARFPGPMLDGGRVIQFVRSRADPWNLDPERLVVSGRSAGAAMALWLAFRDDLADRDSTDPLERVSTRPAAVGTVGAQSTLDPREIAEWISPATASHPAFAQLFGRGQPLHLYREASAIHHLSADDPAAFLFYTDSGGEIPVDAKPGTGVHHPRFGYVLRDRMQDLGLACTVRLGMDYGNDFPRMFEDMAEFFAKAVSKASR